MSEKNLRHWLSREIRKRGGHVQNIEDAYSTGVPDMNICINGREAWIECKYLKAWPKRAGTGVRVKFRPGQVNWLVKRGRAGGRAFVALQVGDERFLFHSGYAVGLENGAWNQEQVRAHAISGNEAILYWLADVLGDMAHEPLSLTTLQIS